MLPRPGKFPGLFRFPTIMDARENSQLVFFLPPTGGFDRILRLTFANARENQINNDRHMPCQNCHAVNYASKCVAEEIFNGIL